MISAKLPRFPSRSYSHVARGVALCLLLAGTAAPAQMQLPNLTGGGAGGGGGIGALLGGLLPNVASVGAGNAAGVLGYCMKNKFLRGGDAASVLGQLTGVAGGKAAPGYAEGQKGLLQMDGTNLSLGGLKSQATTKICDLVLKRAQTLL